MPEEIASTPVIYKNVIQANEPFIVTSQANSALESYHRPESRGSTVKVTADQLRRAKIQSENMLRARFPDLHPSQIHEVLSFFYGPLLPKDEMRDDISTREKTDSAFAQKTAIHNIYFASTGRASPAYVDKVFDTAVVHDNLARGFSDSEVSKYDSGMMAFLGIAKVMKQMGGKVYLPGGLAETEAMDVENAIDGCGIFQNQRGENVAILFDAKGQRFYPPNDRLRRRGLRIQADFETPRLVDPKTLPSDLGELRRLLRQEAVDTTLRTRMVVPTDPSKLMTMKEAYRRAGGNKVEALKLFAQTSDDVEGRIAKGISDSINLIIA